MPDASGALAPKPSRWVEFLTRLKIARSKTRAADRRRRRVTKERLADAEVILASIIDHGDVIADGWIEDRGAPDRAVALLVMLPEGRFRQLCMFGAEIEDDGGECDGEGEG